MRFAAPMALAFLLFFSQGCATLVAKSPDANLQIESWIKNHKYDKALETIAAMSADHGDYERLIRSVPSIKKQREQFIMTVIQQAKSFEPQQDWVNALSTINSGLAKLPQSPELRGLYDYYEEKRQARINNDEAAIVIAKAQYIIDSRPFQESKLYNADNAFSAQQEFNDYLDQALEVSRQLYAIGQRYWQQDKGLQASKALRLSIQTANNELSAELLAEIEQLLGSELAAQNDNSSAAKADQIDPLVSEFYRHLRADNFVAAQITLNELRALNYNGSFTLQQRLQTRKNSRVEALINNGNRLYNSGHIQAAIEQWQLAQTLAPDNQAISQQLARAERFIGNLERWKTEE